MRKSWSNCDRCQLHQHRRRVVLYRGECPCQVLFIGEAPGKTEDRLGIPFIGPSGRVLDELLEEATLSLQARVSGYEEPTIGVTNIVGCIPYSNPANKASAVRPPIPDEVDACAPRLAETIQAAAPKLIILLGKSARTYTKQIEAASPGTPIRCLHHPAYILRSGGVSSFPGSQFLVHLRDALQELHGTHDAQESP